MKFFIFALTGTLIAATQAATNFKSTCNIASNQMTSLAASIAQLKAVAHQEGHAAIAAKCDEASRHLAIARSSWNAISSNFATFPWYARSSPHANECQSRLSLCGSCLGWIYARPEMNRCPRYRRPIEDCRGGHRSCQTTCGQVWNWPSPPGHYGPQPSGYHRQRRHSSKSLCPANTSACPICPDKPGKSGKKCEATGHECVDTQTEITSCGGCINGGKGENCLLIEGGDEVGCESGVCRVFSVHPGFELNPSTGRPVPK